MKIKDLRKALEDLKDLPDDTELVAQVDNGVRLSEAELSFETAGKDEKNKWCDENYGEKVILVRLLS